MKSEEILKIMAQDFGTTDLTKLNQLLKSKTSDEIKYRIMGKKLGLGYRVAIKALTAEGIKIYDVSRVKLVLYKEIEKFEKAAPKTERHPGSEKPKAKLKFKKPPLPDAESEKEPVIKTKKDSGHKGSAYIPRKTAR